MVTGQWPGSGPENFTPRIEGMHGFMIFPCLLLTGLKFQEEAFEVDAVRKLRLQLKRDPCEIQLNMN